MLKLTPEVINAAIFGFEEQKRHIDSQISDLRAMLPGRSKEAPSTPEAPQRKRRQMSPAGRRAIAEAQRKRWAASRKTAEPTAKEETPKPKRKLSRAGRAAIVAATKRRWALQRAEAARTTAKKAAPSKTVKKVAAVKKAVVKKAVKKSASVPEQSPTTSASQ